MITVIKNSYERTLLCFIPKLVAHVVTEMMLVISLSLI